MDDLQNLTDTDIETATAEQNRKLELLKLRQERWVTYCALGGLITLESDNPELPQTIKQVTVTEFAQEIGVSRQTLYDWKKTIPDFPMRVRQRREEIWPASRETALFNRMYLIAMTTKDPKGLADLGRLLAGHFSKLRLPTQPTEHKFEGESWTSLLARKREAVEGEVVHDTPSSNA